MRRVVVRTLLALLAVLLVTGIAIWFGGRAYLARSVAQYDGTLQVRGLNAPVEITFDAKGIPQVWAKSDADAWFAMGWLHASERLFQMELIRRMAGGELSELFGEAAYDTDVFQRRVGFARRARAELGNVDPHSREVLQRYVAGINAWIAQAEVLPPELVLLRAKPRPWEPVDCLTIMKYQTWYSHEITDLDEQYQALIARLDGPAKSLLSRGHGWSPATVPEELVPRGMSGASNSWVVSPSHSASGAALHAADPHLSVNQVPGLWYLAGIHSDEGTNVVGVTYGGAPFVVMGHNESISFSFTAASVDLTDYFDETLTASMPIESVEERIVVKGESTPRRLVVKSTPRGVLLEESGGKGLALRWAGFDFSSADAIAGGLALQRARNFDEFRAAVTRFGALDANWIYADRNGNIGYQLAAPVPVRDYDTFMRQDGSNANAVWRGYRTLAEVPSALNPQRGWLASCNNRVAPETWPVSVPGFYDPWRIPRAEALLASKPKLTTGDMHRFQLDVVSGIATRWKELAAVGAAHAGRSDDAAALRAWNGEMSADSREATLFVGWWISLARELFEDELGDEWKEGRVMVDQLLTAPVPSLIDDHRTPELESVADISARAWRNAVDLAKGRKWGEASELVARHPLSRVPLFGSWLNLDRGPIPRPGDGGSLSANFHSYDEKRGIFRSHVGPSMRFVLDWSQPDAFTLTGALGQSGNPFSPHYADFFEMSASGESWNVAFTRAAVWGRKKTVLRLVP